MITEIEDYFSKGCGRCGRFDTPECSVRQWHDGLSKLRDICLGEGLSETVKWGHPCYMHADRNIVIMGAFREDFRLTFFNGSLMKDPDGLLVKRGANTQQADIIRFTAHSQVVDLEPSIRAYLKEAMGYAQAGIKPVKDSREPDIPDELAEALDADPELAEAFHRLTPGRRKSYVLNLNSAKQSATRVNRIAKFRDKIIAGKGALDR